MKKHSFIYQTPNTEKIKSMITALGSIICIILVGVLISLTWYKLIYYLPFLDKLYVLVRGDIVGVTLLGLFYAQFIGGIFFIPSPDELIFYYSLVKGNPILPAFLVATLGFVLAQIPNYFIGKKLSKPVLHLMPKRRVYKVRRFMQKYGSTGIFLFNALPLPSPILSFVSGLSNYNFSRLIILTILGKSVKYGIIAVFFFVIQ